MASRKSPFDMLLAMMKSRFEFVQCMADSGTTEEKLNELGERAVEAVLKHVATHIDHVPVEGGKLILDIIQESPLPDDLKGRLRDSIGEKVSMSEGVGGANVGGNHGGKQVNMHYHNYMYAAEWDTYLNKDVPFPKKLYVLAQNFMDKGMSRASEKTKSRAVALALYMHNPERAVPVAEKLRELDSFKAILAKMSPRPTIQSDESVEFPERVDDFKSLYPTMHGAAFTRDPPAECRIHADDLSMIYGEATCRKTKNGNSGAASGAVAIRRQSSTPALHADVIAGLQTMLQHVQQAPPHESVAIPGLQIFTDRRVQPGPVVHVPQQLALQAPSQPPGAAAPQMAMPPALPPPLPPPGVAALQDVAKPHGDVAPDAITSQLTLKLQEKKKAGKYKDTDESGDDNTSSKRQKTTPGVMKKPLASATPGVMKKPVASVNLYLWLTSSLDNLDRG